MDSQLVVLVVEDHPEVLASLILFVEIYEGAVVLSANSYVAAVKEITAAKRIDLLLCDVHLPGEMNGVDVAELAVANHPGIAVVIASADPPSEVSGLTDRYSFLRKPFGIEEMARHIDVAFLKLRNR